jgi:hypothetical protein
MLEILTLFFSSSTPEKGLEIKLFTPVFTASITCPFVRSDVTNSYRGIFPSVLRVALSHCNPAIPGMCQSEITKSKLLFLSYEMQALHQELILCTQNRVVLKYE